MPAHDGNTKWHVIINIAISPQEARNASSGSAN
jgi:hypothetical protein